MKIEREKYNESEWVTGGSEEGWLEITVEKNLDAVIKVVSEIISEKKGELWDVK